jgi:hypothetical protein
MGGDQTAILNVTSDLAGSVQVKAPPDTCIRACAATADEESVR